MTYPLATLGPSIDATGISAPTYLDIYQSLIASFKAIYGSDIYITPDSQDGQFLAIIARAIHDSNDAAINLFQGFSPSFAQDANLSSLVKINGLSRNIATYSTAVGNVVGQVGTVILAGVVKDTSGNLWNLPTSVTIPIAGTIAVTVTAQNPGSLVAGIGAINQINNPQLGWQSFTNTSAAVAGNPIESDAALRVRQSLSTAVPALGIKEAIYSAIGIVPGVVRFTVYENDTAITDVNGIPAHTIAAVVQGGAVTDICQAIYSKKPPGIQTYGSTSLTVYDTYGLPCLIHYEVLATVPIYFDVVIKALTGYISSTGDSLKTAIYNLINSLSIDEDVRYTQCIGAASLITTPEGQTFYIVSLKLGITPAPTGVVDIPIAFNQAATNLTSNITLTVT
jgi:uncharacterized phage protein gp47/JayE